MDMLFSSPHKQRASDVAAASILSEGNSSDSGHYEVMVSRALRSTARW